MVEGSCLLRPSVPQGQAANSLELGGRLLANQDRSFKEQEGSVACPESSLHVFVRAFFFFFFSVLGNRSGCQCTSGWWGKGRVKAEPSKKEQPTFEVTSLLRPAPGRCAGEVCWRRRFTQVLLRLWPGTWAQRASQATWVGTSPQPAQPSSPRDVPPPRHAGTATPGGAGSLPAGKRAAGAWEAPVVRSPLLATAALRPWQCGERGGTAEVRESLHLVTAQLG